ncbi:MAG: InlB B-repeat-containing protein [Firmicutes bacterium]|nr:InlB B-repeat-containing protein [Bacillota bacterium]
MKKIMKIVIIVVVVCLFGTTIFACVITPDLEPLEPKPCPYEYLYNIPSADYIPLHTVTFNNYDGTLLSTQRISSNQNAIPPRVPRRRGYQFTGWNYSYQNIVAPSILTAQFAAATVPEFTFRQVVLPFIYTSSMYTTTIASDCSSYIFHSSSNTNKIYRITARDFSVDYIEFNLSPGAIAYHNGELYATLARRPFFQPQAQNGYVAIIDVQSFEVLDTHETELVPFSIAVTSSGIIVISNAVGQWTDIRAYNRNGELISESFIRHSSPIVYNAFTSRIYFVTTDISPRNLSAFDIDEKGNLSFAIDSPYHGDHILGTYLSISPSGESIFNGFGNVFIADDYGRDMRFRGSLGFDTQNLDRSGNNINSIAFSDCGREFFIARHNGDIYSYEYSTFNKLGNFTIEGHPLFVFVDQHTLYTIYSCENGTLFIKNICIYSPCTNLMPAHITVHPLSLNNNSARLNGLTNTHIYANPWVYRHVVVYTQFFDNRAFIVDAQNNSLHIIDNINLTQTVLRFNHSPNSLRFYRYQLLVGFGVNGIVSVFDLETFTFSHNYFVGLTFGDFALGADNHFYFAPGIWLGGAFNICRETFQRSEGTMTSDNVARFTIHPTRTMLHFANSGVSPQNIITIVYYDGQISRVDSSRYHGTHQIGNRLRISPCGTLIFTNNGSIFSSHPNREQDLIFQRTFTRFNDMTFCTTRNQAFVATNNAIRVYDLTALKYIGSIVSTHSVRELSIVNNQIIAISHTSTNRYLEIIALYT